MLRVKAKTAFVDLLIKIKLIAGGSTSRTLLAKLRLVSLTLSKIRKTQGDKGLAMYLKSSAVSLQQGMSGYHIKDLTQVGPRVSRTKGTGLPRIIPASHRLILINKRPGYLILMRFYLSIFYLYRVIEFKGKLKINSITDPGKQFDLSLFVKYVPKFNELMTRGRSVLSDPAGYMRRKFSVFPIFKASPLTSFTYGFFNYDHLDKSSSDYKSRISQVKKSKWSTHVFPLWFAYKAIPHFKVSTSMRLFYNHFYYDKNSLSSLHLIPLATTWFEKLPKLLWGEDQPGRNLLTEKSIGKLSLKKEAAGKVRVFAMVDPITQWLLAPLHKYLFSILKAIPMDGTFNQLKPVFRLFKTQGIKSFFSLDLSSATDRLPISIQSLLLTNLIPTPNWDFGQVWADILVNRTYWLKSKDFDIDKGYRYSVGQPMGALSSWAMLAYSHHFIVQVAAWEAGHPKYTLFKKYAVLGDDLVIADWKVAKSYLKILDIIGVECGLHKSILSHNGSGIEFAKSTFIDKVNVSPISFKELQVALSDLSAWAAFIKKFNLNWDRQARVLGHGYKSRRKDFNHLNHALQSVSLSQIVKADFKSDTLRLRRGAPKSFDGIYLQLFRRNVLGPLLRLLENRDTTFKQFHGDQLTFLKERLSPKWKSEWILLASLYREVWDGGIKRAFGELKGIIKTLKSFVAEVDHRNKGFQSLSLWQEKIEKRNPSFDQALDIYLKAQRMLSRVSTDPYLIDESVKKKRLEGKLPYQVRIFRAWSRLTHKVINDYRKSKK
uniref:RNA-dependent RNA polymerase n=1 Tax=Plasmopara viticola lesion associated mitovirus 14 TaxID=2719439 RepID=A0A6G9RT86_9VIRU|nr:RNA-dependent RNA polymerase [Plasmopara viticola lesion associated mitovirus 14]